MGYPRERAESAKGWDIANRSMTRYMFIKNCAIAAANEISSERQAVFHAKLDAIGCP